MHWLGFLGTQGAEWFDYIVTDRLRGAAGDATVLHRALPLSRLLYAQRYAARDRPAKRLAGRRRGSRKTPSSSAASTMHTRSRRRCSTPDADPGCDPRHACCGWQPASPRTRPMPICVARRQSAGSRRNARSSRCVAWARTSPDRASPTSSSTPGRTTPERPPTMRFSSRLPLLNLHRGNARESQRRGEPVARDGRVPGARHSPISRRNERRAIELARAPEQARMRCARRWQCARASPLLVSIWNATLVVSRTHSPRPGTTTNSHASAAATSRKECLQAIDRLGGRRTKRPLPPSMRARRLGPGHSGVGAKPDWRCAK